MYLLEFHTRSDPSINALATALGLERDLISVCRKAMILLNKCSLEMLVCCISHM